MGVEHLVVDRAMECQSHAVGKAALVEEVEERRVGPFLQRAHRREEHLRVKKCAVVVDGVAIVVLVADYNERSIHLKYAYICKDHIKL